MLIYVDNKKMKLKKEKYDSFGMAMNEIINTLKKENKMIKDVFVDGKLINDYEIINMNKLTSIEIITKSQYEILMESLVKARVQVKDYMRIFNVRKATSKDDVFVDIDESELYNKVMFLYWFNSLLKLIKETGAFDYKYIMFSHFAKAIDEQVKNIEGITSRIKNQEYTELLRAMTLNIIPLLDFFEEEYHLIVKRLTEDEKSKNLLN